MLTVLASLLCLNQILTVKPLASSNRFTLDFFHKINTKNVRANYAFSPVGIQSTLTMLHSVANIRAAKAMQTVLGLSSDADVVDQDLQRFLKYNNNDAIKIATRIYSTSFGLNQNLSSTLKESYGVEIESTAFDQNFVKSANAWIQNATNGLVQTVLREKNINKSSNVLLLNAIALNATWNGKYKLSEQKHFRYLNGDHLTDYMTVEGRFQHGSLDGIRLINLPFQKNPDLHMLLIIPESEAEPLSSFIDRLDQKLYSEIEGALSYGKVILEVPIFSVYTTVKARDFLGSLGLDDLFENGAFNISSEGNLNDSDVLQKVAFHVNKGSVSANNEFDHFWRRTIVAQPVLFQVVRPFIFVVKNPASDKILLIGHYSYL